MSGRERTRPHAHMCSRTHVFPSLHFSFSFVFVFSDFLSFLGEHFFISKGLKVFEKCIFFQKKMSLPEIPAVILVFVLSFKN